MKQANLLLLVLMLSFSNCTENKQATAHPKAEEKVVNENFDWLLGNWLRNYENEGKETFEVWVKNSSTQYTGVGFTMQNQDTLQLENITLEKAENTWVLTVQLADGSAPIAFNMTSHTDEEFVCENKAHDFPKLIKYWKNGDKLNALVSGDEMQISFDFDRIVKE